MRVGLVLDSASSFTTQTPPPPQTGSISGGVVLQGRPAGYDGSSSAWNWQDGPTYAANHLR
ncbi:MAG: hypothetical protein ACPLQO_09500 [Desulfotomaculales bacterium]